MDINAIGIQFDPSPAKRGAKEAKKAVGEMADSVARDLDKVEEAGKDTGKAVVQAGKKIESGADEGRRAVDKLGKARGFDKLANSARGSFGALAGGVIDMLDTFGLLDSRMGMMVRRAQSGVQSVGRLRGVVAGMGPAAATAGTGMAAAGAGGTAMAGGATAAAAGATGLMAAIAPLLPIILAIAAALVAIAGTGLAVAGVFKAIKASIPEAAAIEAVTARFAVLLGSYEEAEKRIASLNKFSDSTPFTDSEVFEAGVMLQSMTDGALATEDSLRSIGGAAVVAGKGFSEVAELAGGAFNMMRLGMDYREPLKTMVKYGLISGDTLKTVVALGDQAKKSGDAAGNFTEQWALVYADLQKNQTALLVQSQTWNGLISTLSGKWDQLKAEFGAPIMDALKPVLTDLTQLVTDLTPMAAKFGQALGDGITFVIQVLKGGEIGKLLQLGLMAAFEFAVANWVTYMQLAVGGIAKVIAAVIGNAITLPIKLFVSIFTGAVDFIGKLITGDFSGAIEMVLGFFLQGGTGVIGNMGTMVLNELGQAFEDAVNVFRNAFYSVWQGISDLMSKGLTQLGKDPLAPVAMPKQLDFFTPTDVSFGDIRGAANDLVGTGARDKFGSFFDDMVAKGEAGRPERPELGAGRGPSPEGEDPMGEMTDKGAKGAKKQKKAIEDTRTELQKLTDAWLDVGTNIDQVATSSVQSIANGMTGAIMSMIDGTKSAKQAFSDMAMSIVSDILRMIIQMQIQLALATALKAMGYSGGGVAHSGGEVGTTNFASGGMTLPTYHSGGMATSEQAIKVEKGESILTRKRAKELEMELAAQRGDRQQPKTGGSEATIINVTDRQEIADAIAARPDAVVNAISRSLPAVRKMIMSGQRA